MVSLHIQTDNVADFEAVLAAMRGPQQMLRGELLTALVPFTGPTTGVAKEWPQPSDLPTVETDPAYAHPVAPAAAGSAEPAKRTRRTKEQMAADEAAKVAPPVETVTHEAPADEPVTETVAETAQVEVAPPADTTPHATDKAAAAPAGDLAVTVRERLKAVRDLHDGAKMIAVLKGFGVSAIKDVDVKRLPEVIATCDAILAAA